jgi:hypothetical protein
MRLLDAFLTSNLTLRLNISFKIWFDELEPLFDAAFDVSTTLSDIPENLPHISS